MEIITIVGARPQFIKAAVLSRAFAGSTNICETIVHTGQHYDANMSQVFFDELEIPPPGVHLGIGSGSHGEQTGAMLAGIDRLLQESRPDLLLVYGDTNSTLAGALAAAKLHIPVAHVEAGLRSFNRRMPEEVNRVLTDHLSELLFCPTPIAVDNLTAEGITDGVHEIGDVMYDSALFFRDKAKASVDAILGPRGLTPRDYVLATVHRAENVADSARLRGIFDALAALAADRPVVLPLHPGCKRRLDEFGIVPHPQILLLPPVPYLEMVTLLSHACLALTDSGGLQKEAAIFDVPCITLREETEWVETVQAGRNRTVGADSAAILTAVADFANSPLAPWTPPYGEGDAGGAICQIIESW
jgi:UDP-GlcNAc3NAcA epimerase